MRTVKFTDCAIHMDERGTWLSILLYQQDTPAARQFVLERRDRLYTAELREYREKRSLDANGYLWALLDKLADVLHSKKEELYLLKVRECGIYKDFHLTEDEYKTFRVAWESMGTGWPTEQVDYTPDGERLVIRAYYGSSQYNTKQMSRLIDSVVEDCKSVGVETLSPEKLALLKEEWNARRD